MKLTKRQFEEIRSKYSRNKIGRPKKGERLGKTLRQIAEKYGISKTYVNDILCGRYERKTTK